MPKVCLHKFNTNAEKIYSDSTQKNKITGKQIKVSVICAILLPSFFSFIEKNKSYVISSFVETKGEAMIAKSAVEFVEYPLRVYCRCHAPKQGNLV